LIPVEQDDGFESECDEMKELKDLWKEKEKDEG